MGSCTRNDHHTHKHHMRKSALVEEGEERGLADGLDRRRLLLGAVEDIAALADLVHVAVALPMDESMDVDGWM